MSSTPESTQYQEAKRIFLDALEIPAGERESWLDQTVNNDSDLRKDIDELLQAHEAAESDDLHMVPISIRDGFDEHERSPDQLVGPWKLLDKVGEGGMGSVYRAERADGAYTRIVALKMLRRGGNSELMDRQLRSEQQLLAQLEHPNIARLYDGGITDDNQPYLVLEFVEGHSITEYCNEIDLGISQRIDLLVEVCDAVAYAHQNLIIHRDLKPPNILVSRSGEVKLLDFGIAKLLSSDDQLTTLLETGSSAMTPAYAAPEQIRNGAITTATDVYSLGVLLYEIISGSRPYELKGLSPAEMERVICVDVPPPPSRRGGMHRLDADLDTIALKALEKDPRRRYATAAALADDLRRYRKGFPIEAKPASTAYRVQKFLHRHRTGSILAALLIIAIITGLSVSLWQTSVASRQRDRAEQRFDTAREAVQTLLFDIHDVIASMPGSTIAREMIVSSSLGYLDRLNATASGDPELQIDIAKAYRRVGDVLGNPSNNNLGRIQEAMESYRQGLIALPTSLPDDSLARTVTRTRAILYEKLGDVYAHIGKIDSALIFLGFAADHFARNVEQYPDDPANLLALAIENVKIGDYTGNPLFPNAGDMEGALEHYHQSLAIIERARSLAPDDRGVLRFQGLVYERLGIMHDRMGKLEEAESSYLQSLDYREDLWRQYPANTEYRRDVGIAHEKIGLVYQQEGRLDEALEKLRVAQDHYQSIAASDPDNVNALVTVAVGKMQLAAIMYSGNQPSYDDREQARQYYHGAREILERVYTIDSSSVQVASHLDDVRTALRRLD